MSETLANMTADVRALLRETTAGFYTDAHIAQWLNEAQRQFVYRTGCLRGVASLSSSYDVRDYALPTDLIDFVSVDRVLYDQDVPLQRLNNHEFIEATLNDPYRAGEPEVYCIVDQRLHLWPIPSSDQDAGTTTLGAAISSTTATTATVADNSIFPYDTGRLLVGSEVIEFRGKSSTTGLLNLRRAVEGSTATTHTNSGTVTERDVWLYYVRAPLTLSATQGSEVPDPFVHTLTYFAASQGYGRRGDARLSQHWMALWESEVSRATGLLSPAGGRKDKFAQIRPFDAGQGHTSFGRV